MPEYIVSSIFVRQLTRGDFFHIERTPEAGPPGGGGQTYVDIPLGRLAVEQLWSFLGVPAPSAAVWPSHSVTAAVLGDPSVSAKLEFAPRQGNNRYRIANQARQALGANRHPAWTPAYGFPAAPDDIGSKDDPRAPDVAAVKLFVIKTTTGEYFAGFVRGPALPTTWPAGLGLERLVDPATSAAVIEFPPTVADLSPLAQRVFDAWSRGPNVLLYGPPGTGKTHAMQEVSRVLREARSGSALLVDPARDDKPFRVTSRSPLPVPVRSDWTTFHQNYGYEHFVLAMLPESAASGGLSLAPRLGTLLDAAVSVDASVEQPAELRAASAVLFVDEINRGNVSRIFGEFITFMENAYRTGAGADALPVPLPGVRVEADGLTESLHRTRGPDVRLPVPWTFPDNVYVLASMNSVDRAVAPLDTALARRFARVEVGPDMDELARWLGLANVRQLIDGTARLMVGADTLEVEPAEATDADAAPSQIGGAEPVSGALRADVPPDGESESDAATLPAAGGLATIPGAMVPNAAETAYLLLYRLNYELAAVLGPDFELGHAYLRPVAAERTESERFLALARVWDQALYPQLRERLSGRPDDLAKILRVAARHATSPGWYIIAPRTRPQGVSDNVGARALYTVPSFEGTAAVRFTDVVRSLRRLAGI